MQAMRDECTRGCDLLVTHGLLTGAPLPHPCWKAATLLPPFTNLPQPTCKHPTPKLRFLQWLVMCPKHAPFVTRCVSNSSGLDQCHHWSGLDSTYTRVGFALDFPRRVVFKSRVRLFWAGNVEFEEDASDDMDEGRAWKRWEEKGRRSHSEK